MKEAALTILGVAAKLFPPLLEFLDHAVNNAPLAHQAIADEIRTVLPVRSETRKALDELEGGDTTP